MPSKRTYREKICLRCETAFAPVTGNQRICGSCKPGAKQILAPRQGPSQSSWLAHQEAVTCRRCGAEPGEQCRTASGTVSWRPHAERFQDSGGIVDPARAYQRAYDRGRRQTRREAMRRRVFAHYGTSCACCGVTERLTIDHINGGGTAHREEIGGSGHEFYAWLIRNDFPSGFQTLCMTCNLSKFTNKRCRIHDPICPTCHRPLDEGFILASRNSKARSNFIAIPAS